MIPLVPRIRIVLVEPEQPRNISAVVRVAANFGLGEVHAVRAAGRFCSEELREMRVASAGAVDLVQLHIHQNQDSALRGSDKVVGTSGRMRNVAVPVSSDIRDFLSGAATSPARQNGETIAVLFGRESKGLTADEMAMCHGLLKLPVSPTFPSMNLSHAVTVILCRALWFRDSEDGLGVSLQPATASREVQEAWLKRVANLAKISPTTGENITVDKQQLRHLLHRASPTHDDMALLFNLLRLK